jgi:hypothetical protein
MLPVITCKRVRPSVLANETYVPEDPLPGFVAPLDSVYGQAAAQHGRTEAAVEPVRATAR